MVEEVLVMRIVSVTTGRADVGHLEPVWREITARWRKGLELTILNVGSHQLPAEWEGFSFFKLPRWWMSDHQGRDSSESIAQNMAAVVSNAASVYTLVAPDVILVFGDRYEALAVVSAALPFGIPIAHIGGGDETTGSYDNQIRHAITKMAHLHFVPHEEAQKRVLAMGEQGWRVHLTGLPSLDGIRQWLEDGDNGPEPERGEELVVIFHSPTLELETAEQQAREVGKALAQIGRPIKGFIPGCDVLHEKVRRAVVDQCIGALESEWLDQEQPSDFYRTLSEAACLVGNSSAGIMEACSFGLPVVNIGSRQEGRVRPENVVDVVGNRKAFVKAIKYALRPEFRTFCQGLVNPYGDGHAAERIVEALAALPAKDLLLKKEWPR